MKCILNDKLSELIYKFKDRQKSVDTFTATIYVGLRKGYTNEFVNKFTVLDIIQAYVSVNKLCVTITETEYIYVEGREPGLIIGLINYPRFPSSNSDIEMKAYELTDILLNFCCQEKITIVMPKKTVTIFNKPNGN